MKVAIIIPSNRPKMLESFVNSIENFPKLREAVEICVCLQSPFTGNEPFLERIDRKFFCEDMGKPVPFVFYREEAMCLYPDADLFWHMDCDHTFHKAVGKVFPKSSDVFNLEIIEFFAENPNAGVVQCNDYLGGLKHGYNFVPCFSAYGLGNSSGGAFIRNIGIKDIVDGATLNVGAGEDKLFFMNVFSMGYDIFKRFNSPVKWEDYVKTRGYSRSMAKFKNPEYSRVATDNNVFGRIMRKFDCPDWDFTDFPEKLMRMHEENKLKR